MWFDRKPVQFSYILTVAGPLPKVLHSTSRGTFYADPGLTDWELYEKAFEEMNAQMVRDGLLEVEQDKANVMFYRIVRNGGKK